MEISHAITRRPGKELAAGITTSKLGPPDYDKALEQFDVYVKTLKNIGVSVIVLDPLAGYPDAHFVEDAAVIVPEVAIITHPGAVSRRGEVSSIESVLQPFRDIKRIHPPGTIDGGDVLIIDGHVFIGLSDRTNEAGATQLGETLTGFGYTWEAVPVAAGLHFKSSVNAVGKATLLTTWHFAEHPTLAGFRRIVVSTQEDYAANTLLINGNLIMPAGYPDARDKLSRLGKPVLELDTSEFRKMDGGLTCLSLRF
jgi:dimethylargininase